VFVVARSHAGAGFPRFARNGNNVLLTWDDEDGATDPYLQAGILLGAALVTRNKTAGDAGDITALRDVEVRIEAELGRLDRMEKCNEGIRRHSETLGDEIRKSRKALELLARKARDTLRALNVELQEEAVERQSPIAIPALSPASETAAASDPGGKAA
jgi:hypothetical protein